MPDHTTPPRVLVVDDEKTVRTFTERVLREGGYEVVTGSDGPAALRVIEQQRRRFSYLGRPAIDRMLNSPTPGYILTGVARETGDATWPNREASQ